MTEMAPNVSLEANTKTDSQSFNKGTRSKQEIHEVINSAYNHHVLVTAYKEGRAIDIIDAPKAEIVKGEKTPAFIIGSGPSLDKSITHLKNWKGGIFCTTSHALSLVRHGIAPTHIVALDPFCTWEEIEGVNWAKTNTVLLAHPGVWPTLIEKWPNKIYMYLENVGDPTSFYNTYQKQMYIERMDQGKGIRDPIFKYIIRKNFPMFACSPPMQLFAADILGYGNIFLAGVDFSYPFGKDRFTDWTVKSNVKEMYPSGLELDWKEADEKVWEECWESHEHPIGEIPPERVPMLTTNGIPSERIHIYYKKNFMSAWRLCQKTIYTTDHGAITEIPYADITKVIKKQGYNFPQTREWFIRKVTDEYLAKISCFVVEAEGGKSFVESDNPLPELYNYILTLFQQYQCPHCHASFHIKDENPMYGPMKNVANNLLDMSKNEPEKYADLAAGLSKITKEMEDGVRGKIFEREGAECPVCKKPGIVHINKLNIEENMKRISLLLEGIKK